MSIRSELNFNAINLIIFMRIIIYIFIIEKKKKINIINIKTLTNIKN